MDFTTHVIICRGHYCAFGSYNEVRFVESPLKARHFTHKRDALKRASETHYEHKVAGGPIMPKELQVVEITMRLVGQKPVEG